MSTDELRAYTDGTNTVAARDEDDARAVVAEYIGGPVEDFDPMTRVPDDKVIAVWLDGVTVDPVACDCADYVRETERDLHTPNGHHPRCGVGHPSKTAAEWVRENGRGLICSTEM